MKERHIREFFGEKREKDPERLTQIGERVAKGLRLEEGTPPSYLSERYQIVGVISNVLYEATEFLGVDVPNVGLLYDWNDVRGSRKYAAILAATEKGIIKFSPEFLKLVAKGLEKNGIGSKPQINSLVNTTAHEVYHHFQMESFPKSSQKDFIKDISNFNMVMKYDLKLEMMPRSRSERGALIFGRQVEKVKSKRIKY